MLNRPADVPRFRRLEPKLRPYLPSFPGERTREHARRVRHLVDRLRRPGPHPEDFSTLKPAGCLRLFTLNAAHGRNRVAHQALVRRSTLEHHLRRIAETVRELDADVVALQEADGPSAWSGNMDHVAMVAGWAELPDHYRGAHNLLRFGRLNLDSGTALLARWPLTEPSSYRFASSWRCTKGFVVATVRVPEWGDLPIDVVSLHLDFLAPRIRRRQIQDLADFLGGRSRPRVVLGDLNFSWHLEPRSLKLFTDTLGLRAHEPESLAPTYPSHRPRFRLDWILISEQLEFADYRTSASRLSDHLGVFADLRLR